MKEPSPPTLEQGIAERERLRPERARNYWVKFADGLPFCAEAGCVATEHLLVVRVKPGAAGGFFSVRCTEHVGDLEVMPGQWWDGDAA
jgi:hypothetical protein